MTQKEKPIRVFDGDNQILIKRITQDELEKTIKQLKKTNEDVSIDCDGDIVFYKEL